MSLFTLFSKYRPKTLAQILEDAVEWNPFSDVLWLDSNDLEWSPGNPVQFNPLTNIQWEAEDKVLY